MAWHPGNNARCDRLTMLSFPGRWAPGTGSGPNSGTFGIPCRDSDKCLTAAGSGALECVIRCLKNATRGDLDSRG
ncbi:hypothetical protein GCM10009087_47960 [Sphingomonas oligophenolica]